jgi:hypothetical protein
MSKLFLCGQRNTQAVHGHVHLHSQSEILVDGVSGDFQEPPPHRGRIGPPLEAPPRRKPHRAETSLPSQPDKIAHPWSESIGVADVVMRSDNSAARELRNHLGKAIQTVLNEGGLFGHLWLAECPTASKMDQRWQAAACSAWSIPENSQEHTKLTRDSKR